MRVLSRPSHKGAEGEEGRQGIEVVTGDLATGEGIQTAVEGTEVIVHLAGTPKGDEVKARHLVRAASQLGRGTWCTSRSSAPTASVVSVDRAMFGYFASGSPQKTIADSGYPGRRHAPPGP